VKDLGAHDELLALAANLPIARAAYDASIGSGGPLSPIHGGCALNWATASSSAKIRLSISARSNAVDDPNG